VLSEHYYESYDIEAAVVKKKSSLNKTPGQSMESPDYFSHAPSEVKRSSKLPEPVYRRKANYYAIHIGAGQIDSLDKSKLVLNDGAIAVFEGQPPPEYSGTEKDPKAGPVYFLPASGSLAVPTGLIFLRFEEGTDARVRESEIKHAGYEIAETLPYAPEAVWVTAEDHSIVRSLNFLSRLQAIPGIRSVEPQMLMAASRR
jgi:hypothetical protein